MEFPISTEDTEEVTAHLTPTKAPGSNGLLLDFYTRFCEVLVPKLQELFIHIFDSAIVPASMGGALIVLILKPVKDPLFSESYRPIFILQLDVKSLTKILALCLNPEFNSPGSERVPAQ